MITRLRIGRAAVLAASLCLIAPALGLRAAPVAEATARDYSLAELRKMLQEVPPEPIFCATGIRWFSFDYPNGLTPATVRALQALHQETRDPRNRRLVLWVLAKSDLPELRAFWLKLQLDPATPAELLPTMARGIGACGSEADLIALAKQLGSSREFDLTVLETLTKRPVTRARPQIAARFNDLKARPELRVYALRALLAVTEDRAALNREALRDPAPEVRVEALVRLAAHPDAATLVAVRQLLTDAAPSVRLQAVSLLRPLADDADQPRLITMLDDRDARVREAVEETLLTFRNNRPAQRGYPFIGTNELSPRRQSLLERAEKPGDPVGRSGRILLELGRDLADRGGFSRAQRLLRQAIPASERREPTPGELHNAASARYELSRLHFFQGREKEALELIEQLAQAPEAAQVRVRDYPLIGETFEEKAREAGARMRADLAANPLRLRVTRLMSGAKPVYRITLMNTGKTAQRVVAFKGKECGILPSKSLSVVVGLRASYSADPAGEVDAPMVLSLEPGGKLSGTAQVTGTLVPLKGDRQDLVTGAEIEEPDGKRRAIWLRAVVQE